MSNSNGNPLYKLTGKSTKVNYNDDENLRSVHVQQTPSQGNPMVNPMGQFNNRKQQVVQQPKQETQVQVLSQKETKLTNDFTILNNVNGGTATVKYSNSFISYPKAQPSYQDGESVNKFQSVQSEAGIKELYGAVLAFCAESRRNSSISRFQKSRDNTWEIYVNGDEYEGVIYFSIDSNNNKNTFVEIKRLTGFGGFSFNNFILNLKEYLVNEKLVTEDDNNNNTSEDETKEEEPQFGFFAAGYVSSDDESDTE